MAKSKYILNLTPDEKSSIRANLHSLDRNTKLYKKLNTMTAKQRISISEDEYNEIEKLLITALNNTTKYPNKNGKEYESAQNSLIKLRASAYELK